MKSHQKCTGTNGCQKAPFTLHTGKKIRHFSICTISVCLFLIVSSCGKDFNDPVSVHPTVYPQAPLGITAQVADNTVFLSWSYRSLQESAAFNIYRRDTLLTEMALLSHCDSLVFIDTEVRNGMPYTYCITAVNSDQYEGPPSAEIVATPGVYSISINNGAEFAKTADVNLNIIGPAGAQLMQIENDTLPHGASWLPFVSTKQWTLSQGDGNKRIYVIFRDADGNQSTTGIHDDIILDSHAAISSFRIAIETDYMLAGDTLRVTLVAGEPYGTASFDIGNLILNKRLFDDAIQGDELADDGTYTLDYVIPPYLDVQNAAIIGKFTDRLGNVAENVQANKTLTIRSLPTPVELFTPEPVQGKEGAVQLAWTICQDGDFLNYRLYRSTDPLLKKNATLVRICTEQTQTACLDSLLEPKIDYYYRVLVSDQQGLSSASNIVRVQLPDFYPPQSLELYTPVLTEAAEVAISWQTATSTDFASYRLVRSTTPALTATVPIFYTNDRRVSFYLDTDLKCETTYYYRLYLFNERGVATGSNIQSVVTPANQPPQAVQLAAPVATVAKSLQLVWSRNRDSDFDSYRLFRSTTPIIDTAQAPVTIINIQDTNSFTDQGLASAKVYYYQIFVYDSQGSNTGSNLVSGQTLP